MITRKDLDQGRVGPKTIENGVVVPPGLQVNGLTLVEHRRRLATMGAIPLSPEEEARIHPDEAAPIEVVHETTANAPETVLLGGDPTVPFLQLGDHS